MVNLLYYVQHNGKCFVCAQGDERGAICKPFAPHCSPPMAADQLIMSVYPPHFTGRPGGEMDSHPRVFPLKTLPCLLTVMPANISPCTNLMPFVASDHQFHDLCVWLVNINLV